MIKGRLLYFFVVLMALILTGFIGIQVYWIRNSMQLREANFRRSVDDAVNVALLKLETIIYARLNAQQADSLNFSTQGATGKSLNVIKKISKAQFSETNEALASKPQGALSDLDNPLISQAATRKQLMLNHMMNQALSATRDFRVEDVVSKGLLDTLMRQELLAKGINTQFEFGVFNPQRNMLMLERTGKYHESLLFKGFSFPLFSGAGLTANDFFLIYFPEQRLYTIRSLWMMTFISLLLVSALIAAFAYSVRTILRQRKLSELKNDFINNMTHEFKTPISTISLACQALSDSDIERTPAMYSDYIHIIGDENRRLGEMAEKILQTAILEKGELHLRKEAINLHDVIKDTIHKIAIQIEIRDGSIQTRLEATQPVVRGDRVHLTNVIYNLLDNANKYTPRKPSIVVSTGDAAGGINISIQDNGTGISKTNQKKIFEKLYRVPTGDVHNVKGFGLGLSYVKFIVDKHQGLVSVESEPGKGSTFTVFLPFEGPDAKS